MGQLTHLAHRAAGMRPGHQVTEPGSQERRPLAAQLLPLRAGGPAAEISLDAVLVMVDMSQAGGHSHRCLPPPQRRPGMLQLRLVLLLADVIQVRGFVAVSAIKK